MHTQVLTPTKESVSVHIPAEMIGHRIEVILNDLDSELKLRFNTPEELRAYLKAIRIDTRGFKFDRDEANERPETTAPRKFNNGDEVRAFFNATSIDTLGFKFDRDEVNER